MGDSNSFGYPDFAQFVVLIWIGASLGRTWPGLGWFVLWTVVAAFGLSVVTSVITNVLGYFYWRRRGLLQVALLPGDTFGPGFSGFLPRFGGSITITLASAGVVALFRAIF